MNIHKQRPSDVPEWRDILVGREYGLRQSAGANKHDLHFCYFPDSWLGGTTERHSWIIDLSFQQASHPVWGRVRGCHCNASDSTHQKTLLHTFVKIDRDWFHLVFCCQQRVYGHLSHFLGLFLIEWWHWGRSSEIMQLCFCIEGNGSCTVW